MNYSPQSCVTPLLPSTHIQCLPTWNEPLSRKTRVRLFALSVDNDLMVSNSYSGCFHCGYIFPGWNCVFETQNQHTVLCPRCQYAAVLALNEVNHLISQFMNQPVFMQRIAFYALLRQLSFSLFNQDLPLSSKMI